MTVDLLTLLSTIDSRLASDTQSQQLRSDVAVALLELQALKEATSRKTMPGDVSVTREGAVTGTGSGLCPCCGRVF